MSGWNAEAQVAADRGDLDECAHEAWEQNGTSRMCADCGQPLIAGVTGDGMSTPDRRIGICDLCDSRTEVRSSGNGFMSICDPCDKARYVNVGKLPQQPIPRPVQKAAPEFDFTGLADRLMQEQKALVAATPPGDLGVEANLMRAISRDLHSAVMLAFLASDVQEARS